MYLSRKSDFPVLRYNSGVIYLDYAATTFMPDAVLRHRTDFDTTIGVSINRSRGYLSKKAEEEYQKSMIRHKVFWNAHQFEFIYTKNATESLNLLASTLGQNLTCSDIIVMSEYEHHSNLLPWKKIAQQKNATIVNLPIIPESGELDYQLLESLPIEKIKIISLSLVSNTTGYLLDIDRIKNFLKRTSAFFILDVSQAVGHIKLNFDKVGADAYCMSAHKMYGPKNIGACAVKRDIISQLPPFLLGGGMTWNILDGSPEWQDGALKFLAGTFDIGLITAWRAACDYIDEIGFEQIEHHEKTLYRKLFSEFSKEEKITIIPAGKGEKSILSFIINDLHPHDISAILSKNKIEIRTGHMCAQQALNAMNYSSICRVSWGIGTTVDDINILVSCVKEIFNGGENGN